MKWNCRSRGSGGCSQGWRSRFLEGITGVKKEQTTFGWHFRVSTPLPLSSSHPGASPILLRVSLRYHPVFPTLGSISNRLLESHSKCTFPTGSRTGSGSQFDPLPTARLPPPDSWQKMERKDCGLLTVSLFHSRSRPPPGPWCQPRPVSRCV